MRIEPVEIYADTTNRAVIRHPDRRFPGVLVQGDTLYSLCHDADRACQAARPTLDWEAYAELHDLRNALWSFLTHYQSVLLEHGLPLPFPEDRPQP